MCGDFYVVRSYTKRKSSVIGPSYEEEIVLL